MFYTHVSVVLILCIPIMICCAYLRIHLHWRNFGFREVNINDFYMSKVCTSRAGYLLYRILLAIVTCTVLIVHIFYYLTSKEYDVTSFLTFFTHWIEILLTVFCVFSFFVVLHNVYTDNNGHSTFTEYPDLELKISTQNDVAKVPSSCQLLSTESHKSSKKQRKLRLRWYHVVISLLFQLAFIGSYFVSLLYWTLLSNNSAKEISVSSFFNIYQHMLVAVIMTLDAIVSPIPVNFLHFVYSASLGILFIVVSYILKVTGVTHGDNVYWFLDWDRPFKIFLFSLGAVFITALLQLLLLFFKHLSQLRQRRFCLNCNCMCTSKDVEQS